MKETRKLKPQWQRKPEATLLFSELVDKVAKQTEFKKSEVKLVIDHFINNITEALVDKKQVPIPNIGILYPTIKRSRVGMALNGGVGKPKKIIVPDRFMLRFQPTIGLKEKLFALTVSKEELDALYKD